MLIESFVYLNESSDDLLNFRKDDKHTLRFNREIEALNVLKDAGIEDKLEIDTKHLGIKSLKKFGKIKLSPELEEKNGKLVFGIHPSFQTKFKTKGLGNIKFEFTKDEAVVTPEFAKNIKLPGIQGTFSLGVKFKQKYKDISHVDPTKAFKEVYVDFNTSF